MLLLARDMILYIETSKDTTKKIRNDKLSKAAGYKINIKENC